MTLLLGMGADPGLAAANAANAAAKDDQRPGERLSGAPSEEPVQATRLVTNLPPLALLYHKDPEERVATVRALARSRDRGLIDDLIRAYSIEFYTPVCHEYAGALGYLTGRRGASAPGEWKAWLAGETAAGRLKTDYRPLHPEALPAEQRSRLQGLGERLGPEHFASAAGALTNQARGDFPASDALRYLVANDHLPEVLAFLSSNWLERALAIKGRDGAFINGLMHDLRGLADPGPLRERLNAHLAACLEATNLVVVHNALWMLAGVEGFTTRLIVPGVTNQVRRLTESPDPKVAAQARRAMNTLDPLWAATQLSYEEVFTDLYQRLGREYPGFQLKGIDWSAVGRELLPRAQTVKSNEAFGLLCLELVARLEDSHAYLMDGLAKVPEVPSPRWDPGFACVIDDHDQPVIYYMDKGGPAEQGGVRVGMTVRSLNGKAADQVLREIMQRTSQYAGYSSQRYLRYHAAQWLGRQWKRGDSVVLETAAPDGSRHSFQLAATLGVRYLPRLPVPISDIRDAGDVSWTLWSNHIGYIYVRRIDNQLLPKLDQAVAALKGAHGLIVDVRGNSGGGFDAPRAHRNFSLTDPEEPGRACFKGPMALLIDARCISAGEGWASWFFAQKRARVFGEATAGASARKTVYTLKNGLFKVQYPVKAYTGFLERPIERRGLEPDVPVRQNARDLAAGRDTVLEAAKRFLESQNQTNLSTQ